ncbi:purine-cytosine permease FCY22 [Colletotrichum acutatum]
MPANPKLPQAGGAARSRATVRVKVGLNGGKAYLVDLFPSRLSRGALDGGCSQNMDGETGASVAKITPVSSFATSSRLGWALSTPMERDLIAHDSATEVKSTRCPIGLFSSKILAVQKTGLPQEPEGSQTSARIPLVWQRAVA